MALVRLRRSVRAIALDEGDRVLLCRFVLPKPTGPIVVWAAPGGGVERGESVLAALQRELREETGLVIDGEPPHVWHQEVIDPGHAGGGCATSPDIGARTCSHRATWPRRWRR
ncbi:NUDIX domain-containing protein [Streptomyces sp. CL12]|uniref:NUDIX domain-containing protein n=1 Tax=Streptomyces sp. CL12 TaxID=3391744 RepID=UPI003A7FA24F